MKKQIYNPHRQKEVGCFTNTSRRFIFIHIYKNASITIRNSLGIWDWEDYNKVIIPSATSLCVMRSPLGRAISIYQYLLRLETNGMPTMHPTHLTIKSDFYKERKNPIISFNHFLDEIDGGNFYDATTSPQIKFLKDKNIKVADIDEILIHENLDKEFNKFKKKYNIKNEVKLSHDNASPSHTRDILNDYVENNESVRKRILSIYHEDADLYESIINRRKK